MKLCRYLTTYVLYCSGSWATKLVLPQIVTTSNTPAEVKSVPPVSLQRVLNQESAVVDSHHPKVPGRSPYRYLEGPKNDILRVDSLNFTLHDYNDEWFSYVWVLKGEVLEDVGPKPQYTVSLSINGTDVGSATNPISHQGQTYGQLQVYQDGKKSKPIRKGTVAMVFWTFSPREYTNRGNHTLRVHMFDTKGKRMTDWEGTTWINGTGEGWPPEPPDIAGVDNGAGYGVER